MKNNKLKWFLENFEEVISAFLMSSVVTLLFIQVFFRFGLGKSIPWTEELSRFCFLGMVYLCTSLAAKSGSHIRVTAQFKLLPAKAQNFMVIISDCIWMVFNVVVIWQGFLLFGEMTKYPLISPVLDWDLKYIFLILPLAFILQIIRTGQRYYRWVKAGATERLVQYEEEGIEVENVT